MKDEERKTIKESPVKKGRRKKRVMDYRDFVAGIKGKR